jgi:hypothetical protein
MAADLARARALLEARDGRAEGEPLLLSCASAPLARSLLFEYAMRRAQAGDAVLYVCASKAALEQAQFAKPGDDGESDAALARIQIKYVGTDAGLRQLLASFHLIAPPAPRLLLIDNLHAFFALDCEAAQPAADKPFDSHGARERMSLTFALALSAAEYIAQEAAGSACSLVVSIVESAPPGAGSTELAVRRHSFGRRMRAHGPLGGPPSGAHMGVYAIEEVGYVETLHAWLTTAAEQADLRVAPAGGGDLVLVRIESSRAAQLSLPQPERLETLGGPP